MKKISAFPSLLLLTICAWGLMTRVVSAQLPGTLTDGLVSYYTFDGNANDVVGTNNGTAVGVTSTNGVTGAANSAYSFNGASSYVTAPYNPFTNNQFTWSLWFKVDTTNSQSFPLMAATFLGDGAVSPSIAASFAAGSSSNFVQFFTYDPAISGESNSQNAIEVPSNFLGQWTMLSVTSDSNNTRSLYLNGVLVTNKPSTGYGQEIGGLLLGSDRFGRDEFSLFGSLDDVAIYNRPLSSTEVTELYTAQSVPEPSTYALLLLSGAASLWALKRRKS